MEESGSECGSEGLFCRAPLEVREGIPMFSPEDEYVANYEQISTDHLTAEAQTGENPFMQEDQWRESEAETRRLIRKHATGTLLLDVGVGLGRLIGPLTEYDRYGVDISWQYLRRAREVGIQCAFCRAHELPYVDGAFDVVVCTDVLEHVLDVNQALTSILRVLNPGGVLVIRVPYRESLEPYAAETAPYQFAHLRTFDEYGVRLLAEKIFGCTVVEVTYSGTYLSPERMKYPLPRGNWTIVRATRLVQRFLPSLGRNLAAYMFWPVEMNAVIKKRA